MFWSLFDFCRKVFRLTDSLTAGIQREGKHVEGSSQLCTSKMNNWNDAKNHIAIFNSLADSGRIYPLKITAFPHCLKNCAELFGKKYMQHLAKNKLAWFIFGLVSEKYGSFFYWKKK